MGHEVTVLTTEKVSSEVNLNLDCSSFKVITYQLSHSKLIGTRKNLTNIDLINSGKNSFKNKFTVSLKNLLQKFEGTGAFTWDARIPNMLSTGQNNAYKKVQNNWDLVVSTFAPYSTHKIAYKLKKNGLAKNWIADYRDLWTQSHLFRGLFPFTLYEEYLERKINNTADYITTVSEPLAKKIRDKYNILNVRVIENGFDLDDLDKIPKKKYWKNKKIRIIYTGSIYRGFRDPSQLFEAINYISRSNNKKLLNNLQVLFAGGMKGKNYINELIYKYKIKDYVKHIGMLKREEVLHMQRDANVLLFLENETNRTKGILTGKIFEYMASGSEIWVVGLDSNSSVGRLITKSHHVCFCKDAKKLETKLIELLSGIIVKVNKINNELVNYYSRENLAKKMLTLVGRL